MKELIAIQSELNAPKNQRNNFGKYFYRSNEDILEALKPLLRKHECFVNQSDRVEMIGDRYYIVATATITNKEGQSVSVEAYAREAESQSGMQPAQLSGSTSSYARKYALNGLFAIDDNKDPDSTNRHGIDEKPTVTPKKVRVTKALKDKVAGCKTTDELLKLFGSNAEYKTDQSIKELFGARRKEIENAAK